MNYTEIVKRHYKTGGEIAALRSAEAVDCLLDSVKQSDPAAYMRFMRAQHEAWCGPHFDEAFAEWQVSRLYHKGADGKIYKGGHWTLEETGEFFARYRNKIPSQYNEYDFHVALNAEYNDYCVWAKQTFGDDYEQKIVEMAIWFWMLDDDYSGDGKIWEYFGSNN